MPILIVVFGVLFVYAVVRVTWLLARLGVSAACRRLIERAPARRHPWAERQAAWSFADAWRKLWSSEDR